MLSPAFHTEANTVHGWLIYATPQPETLPQDEDLSPLFVCVLCCGRAMLASHQAASLHFLPGIPHAQSAGCCHQSWDHRRDTWKTCE